MDISIYYIYYYYMNVYIYSTTNDKRKEAAKRSPSGELK